MQTYEPGDRIYIFGFSRGAYAARVLAGFLHKCGSVVEREGPRAANLPRAFAVEGRRMVRLDAALPESAQKQAGIQA